MLAVAALVGCVGLLASIGDHAPAAGIAAVVESVFGPGLIALAWLAGAVGLGVGLLRGAWTLGACLGVALMLFVAHLLGVLGLFAGRTAQATAWAPVVTGWALLGWRWWRSPPVFRAERISPIALVCVPAIGVLTVASCLPAGTIWASEAHGYDVVSYHLALPAEWRQRGRIEPLAHNVYSYLPSFMEASFAQLDAMMGGPGPGRGLGFSGLAAQMLHGMLAVCGAIVTGRLVRAVSERAGVGVHPAAPMLGAVVVMSVPWVVVTGSMAYNEMGVIVGFAGALFAAASGAMSPIARGLVIGALCGGAVSCKPTAMFLCVPSVVLAVLWARPRREWAAVLLSAAAAGLAMIAPWLIRNWLHGGNPVFPFATGLFGAAHWTPEQAARWAGGHAPDAPLPARLGQLFSAARGLAHPQWSIFAPLTVAGIAACMAARGNDAGTRGLRRIGLLLSGMTAVILGAWLVAGHQQSRFLLPLVVPGAVAAGCATMAFSTPARRWMAAGVGAAAALAMSIHSAVIFAGENGGRPNVALVDGATELNGARRIAVWATLSEVEQEASWGSMNPTAATNLLMSRLHGMAAGGGGGGGGAGRVYLLGDATPLYFVIPLLYHTTWDRSPIGSALRAGMDPVAALRDLGVTHVLINFAELDRLGSDGWYDPQVTPEWVRDEFLPRCEVLRVWPATGSVLVALPRGEPPPAQR